MSFFLLFPTPPSPAPLLARCSDLRCSSTHWVMRGPCEARCQRGTPQMESLRSGAGACVSGGWRRCRAAAHSPPSSEKTKSNNPHRPPPGSIVYYSGATLAPADSRDWAAARASISSVSRGGGSQGLGQGTSPLGSSVSLPRVASHYLADRPWQTRLPLNGSSGACLPVPLAFCPPSRAFLPPRHAASFFRATGVRGSE